MTNEQSLIKTIVDVIDHGRRDIIQRRNNAKGEVSEHYYEGMRVALAEIQSFIEKFLKP